MNRINNVQSILIENCKKNDSRAQMKLYDLYCKAMFNTAFNLTKDDMTAQDMMQEAFIKAFAKINTYTFIAFPNGFINLKPFCCCFYFCFCWCCF